LNSNSLKLEDIYVCTVYTPCNIDLYFTGIHILTVEYHLHIHVLEYIKNVTTSKCV